MAKLPDVWFGYVFICGLWFACWFDFVIVVYCYWVGGFWGL